MKNKILFAVAVLLVLVAGLAAYLFRSSGQPEPVSAAIAPLPVPPAESPALESPPPRPVSQLPLPPLTKSDGFVLEKLAGLAGNQALVKLVYSERIIHNIVVTVDNLPQQRVPAKVMPLRPPQGGFLVFDSGGSLTMSPDNAHRYAPYVSLAKAIDSGKLVELYVRLYPLFQQSYAELGYPGRNFNDQLIETLDDLLAAPAVVEPVRLSQPGYFYQFADPAWESLSIGQKIMLRLGGENEKVVKNKLREIKQELALHSNELAAD